MEVVAPEIAIPFLYHWYIGLVPPLVGVALKLTLVPEQIVVPGLAMMDTAGVSGAVIVIGIWLLLAVAVVAQLALLVITTENWSPLLIADVP